MTIAETVNSNLKPGDVVYTNDVHSKAAANDVVALKDIIDNAVYVGSFVLKMALDSLMYRVTYIGLIQGSLVGVAGLGWPLDPNSCTLEDMEIRRIAGNIGLSLKNKFGYYMSSHGVVIPTRQSNSVNKKTNDPYPHSCPLCKGKAYVGFAQVECVGIGCRNYKTYRKEV